MLAPGPYVLRIFAYLGRPKGHYRADGSLNPKGEGSPWPTRKPDGSNIAKLVEDALVAVGAIPDDAACVELNVFKRWALPSIAGPRVEVDVMALVRREQEASPEPSRSELVANA